MRRAATCSAARPALQAWLADSVAACAAALLHRASLLRPTHRAPLPPPAHCPPARRLLPPPAPTATRLLLPPAGLSAINISLDTLRPDRFEALTRRRGHERVLAAIDSALALGYRPVKVNVVVQRGVNDDEVPAFVELTRSRPVNVRFIEFMPFDDNAWGRGSKMVGYREMVRGWRGLAGWPAVGVAGGGWLMRGEGAANAAGWLAGRLWGGWLLAGL